MPDKNLKKLNRAELLELLISQMKENEALRAENDQLRREAESRMLDLESAGSIAEAALKVNGVFQAAETAAAQYLDNIKRMSELKENIGRRAAEKATYEAEKILQEARQEAQQIVSEAQAEAKRIKDEWDEYWEIVYNRVQKLKKETEE